MLAGNGPTSPTIGSRVSSPAAPAEPGLSLEELQRALRTLKRAPQLSPEARRRGIRALEKACARLAQGPKP